MSNPLESLFPQDIENAAAFPPSYYQALQIKDAIEKAIRYNKTYVNIDLVDLVEGADNPLHPENQEILEKNGFKVEKWHKGRVCFISWHH
jgi:hypothetical protein